MEMDRLIGSADEVGLSVGPLTPEETSYELLARPTKATPEKGPSRSTAKEVEEVIQVVSVESLRDEQINDTELGVIRKWILHAETIPGADELRTFSPEVQQLWAQCQSLHVREGILYRKFVRPDGALQYWQIVVPHSLRSAFLDTVHFGLMNGHPGVERTRHRLQEIAYWRGWTNDVQMSQRCRVCITQTRST